MFHLRSLSAVEVEVKGPLALREQWYLKQRIRSPGFQFSKLYKQKVWDGFVYPGKPLLSSNGECVWRGGRGLVASIQNAFPGLVFGSLHQPPKLVFRDLPDTLRDFQVRALEYIRDFHWGRIAYATNAGKGAIIALSARAGAELGRKVLILCDETAVFDALQEQVQEWAPELVIGTVSAGRKEIPQENVVVAMVPTLSRRLRGPKIKGTNRREAPTAENQAWRNWLQTFSMCLCDEADKATSETWEYTLGWMKQTEWRIGLSGTFPNRFDKKATDEEKVSDLKLEETFGPVLLRVQNMELVERRISSRPVILLYNYRVRVGPKPPNLTPSGYRNWVYDEGIVYNHARHEFIASILPKNVQSTIIVQRVEHGEQLAALLPDSRFLSGSWSPAQRRQALDEFEQGFFQNLIVTNILDRGSNRLGKVEAILFVSNSGSSRQVLQRLGRGLRKGEGKRFLSIIDIADTGHKFFDAQVKKRLAVYAKEGFEVRIVKP